MKVASKGLVYITVPLIVNIILAAAFSLYFRQINTLDRQELESKVRQDSLERAERHTRLAESARVIAQNTGSEYFHQLHFKLLAAAPKHSDGVKTQAADGKARQSIENALGQVQASESQIHFIGIAATAGNIFLSAILAIILYKSVVGRLLQLTEECSRYKPGENLPAPISGNDEIADIEHEFRSMVSSIEAATKRERDTLNYIADIVGSIAPDGRLTHCNKYATTVCGINAGSSITDVLDDQEAQKFFEFMNTARTAEAAEIVLIIKTVEGTAPFRLKGTWSEQGQELYVVARDIRDDLMREESKRQVLSTIGHDMKAPLQSIRLALASIADGIYGKVEPSGVQLLERADIVVHSVLSSLSELLDFERMEQGKLTLQFAPCDLSDVLYDSFECAAVTPTHNLESTAAVTITADSVRLANAFNSLVLAASRLGDGQVSVTVSQAESRANILVGFKTDNPIERFDSMFDRYTSKAQETSRLSLPLSRAIIRAHGGSVETVQRGPDEAEFSISLPFSRDDELRHSDVTTEAYSSNYEPQPEANAMNIALAQPPVSALARLGSSIFKSSSSDKILSIVGWWESRRPLYNLAVGLSGMPSVLLYLALGKPNFIYLAVGILIWGFSANCGYSLGSVTEVLVRKFGFQVKPNFAPGLFGLGLVFSCGLTIAESIIAVLTKAL